MFCFAKQGANWSRAIDVGSSAHEDGEDTGKMPFTSMDPVGAGYSPSRLQLPHLLQVGSRLSTVLLGVNL
jgi:hypothetical protein